MRFGGSVGWILGLDRLSVISRVVALGSGKAVNKNTGTLWIQIIIEIPLGMSFDPACGV